MKKYIYLLLMVIFVTPVFAGVNIIANSSVGNITLDKASAQDIFLGKTMEWSDGSEVIVGVMEKGDAHTAFLGAVVNQSSSQYNKYWKKAIFTGTAIPPEILSNESKMIAFVKSNPGAVGYVSDTSSVSGVSILKLK